MDQKTFTFGSFAEIASIADTNDNQHKNIPRDTKSAKSAPKKRQSGFGRSLSSALDSNAIFNAISNEQPSDAKFRDVFWNRVVLRHFHLSNDTQFSLQQFLECIQLFQQEVSQFAKQKQHDKIIRATELLYSILSYIFSRFEDEEQRHFVESCMEQITSEAFIGTMMDIVMNLRDTYKAEGFKYTSQQLHSSYYITFLRLFTGMLFHAARCGCTEQILHNIMEKYRWNVMSASQDWYGSSSGYQWTWALVTLACLENATGSTLESFLGGRKNMLQWLVDNIRVNHDALPYFCVVFHTLHHEFHKRGAITDAVFHSFLTLYHEEQSHKVFMVPLLKRLFCDETLRMVQLDAEDYYFTFEQSLSKQNQLKEFLRQLDYYDASDREVMLSAFAANRELFGWYWQHSPSMEAVFEGSRRSNITTTAVTRLNFLFDLLSLPMSTLSDDMLERVNTRDLEAFIHDMIYHPKWKAANHGAQLFLFPSQASFKERVSLRIAALSVLHKLYERYVAIENYVAERLSDHPQHKRLIEACRSCITKYFILPFEAFMKMVEDPSFLYRWEQSTNFKMHSWYSHAYRYLAALVLKLMPYYMRFFPHQENKFHYDVIADRIPIDLYTVESWSQMLEQARVPLDWRRREVIFNTNFLLNSHPSWYNHNKLLFKGDELLSVVGSTAEYYFWNRTFFKQSAYRVFDSYLTAVKNALEGNTTMEQIRLNNPTHAQKFAIIGTMKAILSVSTRAEATDFLSRMGFTEAKYPEIGMYLSAPSPHTKIDPSKSKFEIASLVGGTPWAPFAKINNVPLFDLVAKLDEIHKFALDQKNMTWFSRVAYDICHVVSIFDLEYLHGVDTVRAMAQDLPFNCLLIHVDRCLEQDRLMSSMDDHLPAAALLALEREPLYMAPFYCTQILNNLTRCHPSTFTYYQQLLFHILRMGVNKGDLQCEFDRCFVDVLMLEKLLVRDSRCGVMLLNFLMQSLNYNLLVKPGVCLTALAPLLQKFASNSLYKSRIEHILEARKSVITEVEQITQDKSSASKDQNGDNDFDFSFGLDAAKVDDVARNLALLKKQVPADSDSDEDMDVSSDDDTPVGRKESDGSPSSVAADESESEEMERAEQLKKHSAKKEKKRRKKAVTAESDDSSDDESVSDTKKRKHKKKKSNKKKRSKDSHEDDRSEHKKKKKAKKAKKAKAESEESDASPVESKSKPATSKVLDDSSAEESSNESTKKHKMSKKAKKASKEQLDSSAGKKKSKKAKKDSSEQDSDASRDERKKKKSKKRKRSDDDKKGKRKKRRKE